MSMPTYVRSFPHSLKPRSRRTVVWLFLLSLLMTIPTTAQIPGEQLIRNFTPPPWQAREVQWIRDRHPCNKIDDLIEISNEEKFDVVVNFNRCVEDEDEGFLNQLGGGVQLRLKYISSVAVAALTRDEIAAVAEMPGVAFIERQFGFSSTLNVSLPNIGMTAGPLSPNTVAEAFPGLNGAGVNIAILDTGVDNTVHNTFAATPFIGGYDATATPPVFVDPDDDVFHGTHVASIALGQGGAGFPRGVAPGAGLIDVKVIAAGTTCATPGQWAVIVDGLQTTYDNRSTWNVGVINMSLQQCDAGGFVPSDGTDAFSQLVDLAESMGIVVVAAASNNGPGNVGLPTPGAATRAITVAASQTQNTTGRGDDVIACFSSRGPRANDMDGDVIDELKPEVSAPGTHVYDAFCSPVTGILGGRFNTATGTTRASGTSMAAPHVAGLAALIIQQRPAINAASVKDLIITSATPMGPASMPAVDPVWNSASGWGLINAFTALNQPTNTDLTFPSHPASPSWLSPDITTSPFPAQLGVPTTVTVRIRNNGPSAATSARIHFGVHVFSAATPTFHDIGTRIVNIPVDPTGSTPVSIQWTPQDASHQCLQVEIGYGPDTDYSNNTAQRNLNVQNSPAPFMVKNTLTEEPAVIRLVAIQENPDLKWDFSVRPDRVVLGADDCPVMVSAELFPPANAPDGARQVLHVAAVIDTPFGPVTLSGVSVQATKKSDKPCLEIICPGDVRVDAKSAAGAEVEFNVPVRDQCDSKELVVVCNPPSGSLFPVGRTAVSCVARNERGNEARCTFVVDVVPPKLDVRFDPPKHVLITWTGDGTLEEADHVTGPWRPVPNPSNPLRIQVDQARKFYRLNEAPRELPVFRVNGAGIDPGQFQVLSEALGLPQEAYQEQGFIRYTDPDEFQKIPTEVVGKGEQSEDEGEVAEERILFEEIPNIRVMDGAEGLKRVAESLARAGLMTANTPHYVSRAVSAHSMFEAVDVEGKQVVEAPLDTQVNYLLNLGRIPVVGPGAKIKVALNADGRATHMSYSLPKVEEGPSLPLLSQVDADKQARAAFRGLLGQASGAIRMSSRLVYYAPPGEMTTVETLIPHFEYSGSFTPAASGQTVQMRKVFLPAVQAEELVPSVNLRPVQQGNVVGAHAEVKGGLPPYTYVWSSSTVALDPQQSAGSSIEYNAGPAKESPGVEVLTLLVTDANGIRVGASETFALSGDNKARDASASEGGSGGAGGVVDIGTEWIGLSQGLGGSAGNAGGFLTRFILGGGSTIRFNWGDHNAWERDFKDPVHGGNDTPWVDNADAVFYTGHANGDGWTFPGSHDDGFLHYSEARYGNHDLEWLVVAACGPLQPGTSPNRWWQRWGPAFNGLHLLCGYETVTYDNTVEGWKWADYMLRGWTVRQAWMQTGIDVQGPSEIVAVMGVFGPGGISNWNDHYHGRGSVGPDIRNVRGYWKVSSPAG